MFASDSWSFVTDRKYCYESAMLYLVKENVRNS